MMDDVEEASENEMEVEEEEEEHPTLIYYFQNKVMKPRSERNQKVLRLLQARDVDVLRMTAASDSVINFVCFVNGSEVAIYCNTTKHDSGDVSFDLTQIYKHMNDC